MSVNQRHSLAAAGVVGGAGVFVLLSGTPTEIPAPIADELRASAEREVPDGDGPVSVLRGVYLRYGCHGFVGVPADLFVGTKAGQAAAKGYARGVELREQARGGAS